MFSNTPETTKSQSSWMPSMIFQTVRVDQEAREPSGSPSPAKALGLFTSANGAKVIQLPPDVIPSSLYYYCHGSGRAKPALNHWNQSANHVVVMPVAEAWRYG